MSKCDNCPHPQDDICVGNFDVRHFTKEEVIADIIAALKKLYKKDKELIERNINEWCISARFYAYFEQLRQRKYPNLNIDPEYNKNGVRPKCYGLQEDRDTYAVPDVIIHKRNCNKHNNVYIEFKYLGNHPEADFFKLRNFTSNQWLPCVDGGDTKYAYQHGFSIAFDVNNVKFFYFTNGKGPLEQRTYNTSMWKI